ncbi:hypothetical protein Pcinc_018117 [Petrolisthes cinctipes]|uniref:Uncharacterized protein n=1 Tax=Petrolisthes cinctipes TaxID=88211 RepID=A0AAE1KLZ4_PETCI|nr:hypothetical protein Pcinc_018117 [Petrolisthes cinctipes]
MYTVVEGSCTRDFATFIVCCPLCQSSHQQQQDKTSLITDKREEEYTRERERRGGHEREREEEYTREREKRSTREREKRRTRERRDHY